MLTSENEIVILISRLITEIFSAQRPSFFKLWSQINDPKSWWQKCKRESTLKITYYCIFKNIIHVIFDLIRFINICDVQVCSCVFSICILLFSD